MSWRKEGWWDGGALLWDMILLGYRLVSRMMMMINWMWQHRRQSPSSNQERVASAGNQQHSCSITIRNVGLLKSFPPTFTSEPWLVCNCFAMLHYLASISYSYTVVQERVLSSWYVGLRRDRNELCTCSPKFEWKGDVLLHVIILLDLRSVDWLYLKDRQCVCSWLAYWYSQSVRRMYAVLLSHISAKLGHIICAQGWKVLSIMYAVLTLQCNGNV